MDWIKTHPWLTVLIVVGFVVAFNVVWAVMFLLGGDAPATGLN